MLDKDDLQTLQQLFSASEARTTAKIQESEERMTGKIQESEERMTGKIQESEERTSQRAAILMEQVFTPKFNALAENQQAIMEKLIPLERMEKLEGDVDLLKIIIRQMREELDQLKGA